MSGRRPDLTASWNFEFDFRRTPTGSTWHSFPGWFLQNGYLTLGTGKLYHEGLPANGDGTLSWTNLPIQFNCKDSGAKGAGTYCDPDMVPCRTAGTAGAPNPRWCVVNATESGEGAHFEDVATVKDALVKLKYAVGTKRPFFLGVGLRKPHLDFRFPAPFLNRYPAVADIALPTHRTPPSNMPQVAYHDVARSDGEHKLWKSWGYVDPWTPMRNSTVQEMRLHYYGAVSFMDNLLGTCAFFRRRG